jgi:hypothetical protein
MERTILILKCLVLYWTLFNIIIFIGCIDSFTIGEIVVYAIVIAMNVYLCKKVIKESDLDYLCPTNLVKLFLFWVRKSIKKN